MYPGGAQATTGGGPGFGRPPESPEAQQAQNMMQREKAFAMEQQARQQQAQGPSVNPMASQQGKMNQARTMNKQAAKGLAQKAMMAAAKRRIGRGRL